MTKAIQHDTEQPIEMKLVRGASLTLSPSWNFSRELSELGIHVRDPEGRTLYMSLEFKDQITCPHVRIRIVQGGSQEVHLQYDHAFKWRFPSFGFSPQPEIHLLPEGKVKMAIPAFPNEVFAYLKKPD